MSSARSRAQTPAARLAVLKAVAAAVREEIDRVQQTVVQDHDNTGASRWHTGIGTVTINPGKPAIAIGDEAAYLAWVRQNAPEFIRESVSPEFTRILLARFEILNNKLIDPETGERAPDWATILPPRAATTIVRNTDPARQAAAAYLKQNLQTILDQIIEPDED